MNIGHFRNYILLLSVFLTLTITTYSKVEFDESGVIFSLRDKNYSSVCIAGSFNNWSSTEHKLVKTNDLWKIRIDMGFGKYQYKFVIDSKDWIIDPENPSIVKDGNFDNSYFEYSKDNIPEKQISEEKKIEEKKIEEKLDVTFFSFVDKAAQSVTVTGEFNKWNKESFSLNDHDGDGVWEGSFYIEPGRYTYFFVVNNSKWYSDPKASEFEDDGFGGKNSVIIIK